MKLANAFKTTWSNSERSQYGIEQFALPITSVSNLTNSHFFRSDHYSFWERMLPAILLTDTGIVYAKLKIQMDIVWLDCMKKNVFMFL
jgi:hypothetical protein